jgi:hypothetical protein
MTLKKLAPVVEVNDEGMVEFLGKKVEVWCGNYIYTGTLEGLNSTYMKVSNCAVVYETGKLDESSYQDRQVFGKKQGTRIFFYHAIETMSLSRDE